MNFKKIENNGILCALTESDNIVITDVQSALDLLMSANYNIGTKNIIISQKLITKDFLFSAQNLQAKYFKNI